MTTINIKEEAEKLVQQYEEKTKQQIPDFAIDFIIFGMRHGILLAGISLVNFEDVSLK